MEYFGLKVRPVPVVTYVAYGSATFRRKTIGSATYGRMTIFIKDISTVAKLD